MSESRVGKRRSDDSETLTAVLWSGPVSASILFEGVLVGEGAHLRNCIIEKDVEIPPRE